MCLIHRVEQKGSEVLSGQQHQTQLDSIFMVCHSLKFGNVQMNENLFYTDLTTDCICVVYNVSVQLLEEDIFTFVKKELKKLHKVLSTDYPECLEPLKDEDEEQRSSSEAFLKITLNFLRRMKQKELAERLWSSRTI